MQNNSQTNAKKSDDQKSYVASDTSFTPDKNTSSFVTSDMSFTPDASDKKAPSKKASSKFSQQAKQAKNSKSDCDQFTMEEEWEIGIDSPCPKH